MLYHRLVNIFIFFLLLFATFGCVLRQDRPETNYWVLDYRETTENSTLKSNNPHPKNLEVLDAEVNRTYAKTQLVVKDNFSRVRYMPYDLWANRLNDAVPNLIVQRMRAYNVFRQVDRSTGEFTPDYYLETNILNLEKLESDSPQAYLRIEFFLRDAETQKIVLPYKTERYRDLEEDTVVYLIQTYNEMIMKATDIFTARCSQYLSGSLVKEASIEKYYNDYKGDEHASLKQYIDYEALKSAEITSYGELVLRMNSKIDSEIKYSVEGTEASDNPISRNDGIFNQAMTLKEGSYTVTLGEYQDIVIPVEIYPKTRTVIKDEWAELTVRIIDEQQNRVRYTYDVWTKSPDRYDYTQNGSYSSVGDDDPGQPDKVLILAPGTYMIKISGGSWNDLKNFTTVQLSNGDSEILTLVVDPSAEENLLLGAGVLGDEPLLSSKPIIHKGALHGNISLAGNNSDLSDNPVYNLTLTGQMENNLDATFPLIQWTTRSIYDLGLSSSTNTDLRISTDSYSLKNVLLLTPWERLKPLRNFSFYGRADLQTHFFDEHINFSQPKNIIQMDNEGNLVDIKPEQTRFKSKIAFFPMRLKEGTGITYRLVVSPKVSLSLRGGYGWQQELNHDSFSYTGTGFSDVPGDTLTYDIYTENQDQVFHGIESTIVLSAINIMNFIRINSTFDVLFPMGSQARSTRIESENRFNFKIYRNISLDVKLNVLYDKDQKDWVVYDYGSFLRLSYFY